jgi:nitrite reductase/ring-hydroxylating ferredoxin subunit
MWVSAGRAEGLAPGQIRSVRRDVVVCRTPSGELRAVRAICPHRGAPLAFGRLCALVGSARFGEYAVREQTVLRCPWHSFEYDVSTGVAVADPKFRVQVYAVREEAGEILVQVPGSVAEHRGAERTAE